MGGQLYYARHCKQAQANNKSKPTLSKPSYAATDVVHMRMGPGTMRRCIRVVAMHLMHMWIYHQITK